MFSAKEIEPGLKQAGRGWERGKNDSRLVAQAGDFRPIIRVNTSPAEWKYPAWRHPLNPSIQRFRKKSADTSLYLSGMQRFLFYSRPFAAGRLPPAGTGSTPADPPGGMASPTVSGPRRFPYHRAKCSGWPAFPVQTKKWLKKNSRFQVQEPVIIATTGWTTTNLSDAISAPEPTG